MGIWVVAFFYCMYVTLDSDTYDYPQLKENLSNPEDYMACSIYFVDHL